MCCGSDMSQTLHKEQKDDGDWVVYENLEDFKEQFCNWIDASVEEGFSNDSKILSLKKHGRMYFNFRDIALRHPESDTVQNLLIEVEQVERPSRKRNWLHSKTLSTYSKDFRRLPMNLRTLIRRWVVSCLVWIHPIQIKGN